MSTEQVASESLPSNQPQTAVLRSRSVQRELNPLKTACCLITTALLTFVTCGVLMLVLLFLPNQQHLSITHEFGIGFDLSPSYATVAVSYPNGSIHPIARVEGNRAYREMMFRLSLPSSKHIQYALSAPFPRPMITCLITKQSQPVSDIGEGYSDIPRQIWRKALKKLWLPASRDVYTLSRMIRALREQASNFVGEPVSAATISIPHLAALYNEDIRDAFEYLSLLYIDFDPSPCYFRPLHTVFASYAGNNLGICQDYKNDAACKEEEKHIQRQYVLTVGYTHTSLTTSQVSIVGCLFPAEAPALENLRLRYDTRHEEFYWDMVRDMLRSPVVDSWVQGNFSMVLLHGDATEKPRFREVLGEVINDVLDGQVEIIDQQPEFSAAKGAAELAKRAIFRKTKDLADIASEL
ncbi:hypothetical protein FHL15_010845 [Xylaria flabelliformis]|uniref:Uncharacterized protein n=1 Tax=Xylaria flabelliformis TaxID=2512241 RepID=A0A553HK06_9PEZI|nr:hypothetical protein FHL15_010845 [Xylaria flabelliformis]